MRYSACVAADDASVAILRFRSRHTTFIFLRELRFFIPICHYFPCMMAGRKKHSSQRETVSKKLVEEPTGDSNRDEREMPILSPHDLQLTLKELADDDTQALTSLDERLKCMMNHNVFNMFIA